ncbi:MAG: ABC transporter permease subunit [Blautia sp.]|nr:ABC transporter permease subunit [Blautia sp.]
MNMNARLHNGFRPLLEKISAILLALILWQLAAVYIDSSIVLCSPLSVLHRLFTMVREAGFASSVWFTLRHVGAGFFLGLIIGGLLAGAAALSRVVRTLLWPWMAAVKAVPVAAIVVICLIWLSGRNLSVFITFLVVCPVVYQNLLTGLTARDERTVQMDEMALIFRMTRLKKLRYILIPRIFPYLNAACRVAAPMAFKAGVAAEIIGTPAGSIGKQMYLAKTWLATDDLLAWAVVIVLLSAVCEKALLAVLALVGRLNHI